jgi:DNA-binding response OmpR family regulator
MDASILVVDDEADLIATYERILRRLGYAVVSAGSRRTALEAIRSRPLKLVIADLRLPDGDGLNIVRAVRESSRTPPPVIVVTGYTSDANRTKALEAGAVAYIAKPFSISWFSELVRKYLPAAGAERTP